MYLVALAKSQFLSTYFAGRGARVVGGSGEGDHPPTLQNSQTKQLPKTKRLTEANRMNNKGPRGGGVLVHIELTACKELGEGSVICILFVLGYIGIVLSSHSL